MNSIRFATIILVVLVTGMPAVDMAVAGKVYIGAHGGKILLKENATDELNEDQYSGGLAVGLDVLDFKQTILAAEADFSVPLSTGTSDDFGEWKLSTVGLYGCLRVGKKAVYLKVKAGLLYENLTVDADYAEGASDMGLSLGLGGGFRLGKSIFLELEGAVIDERMGYMRGMVGYHF